MNKKRFIPIIIILAALTISILYFEIFRHIQMDKNRIEGTGTIEVTEIEISSKISGRVLDIPWEEGAGIKKDELVVRLDSDELDASKKSIQANLVNAEKNLNRIKDLFNSGSVPKKDFDNALTAYRVAQANYDRIKASIGNAVIHSPINGVVLEKNLETGEMAFPGTPIITMADLSRPWIKIYVKETSLGHVKLGQKAHIFVDSFPDKPFSGKVTAISNKAEFTPRTIQTRDERVKLMFAVKIAVENPDQSLKPGMPADAVIFLNDATKTGKNVSR